MGSGLESSLRAAADVVVGSISLTDLGFAFWLHFNKNVRAVHSTRASSRGLFSAVPSRSAPLIKEATLGSRRAPA